MKSSAESYGVIGLGRFGTALVKTLAAAGKEVIAVDKDEAKVKAVRGYTDYAFVIDELNETSLKETGMQNCGTVTICIGEQIDISILTTMLVTKLGVPHVISKAASEVHGEVLKRLGAEVVYPEADMAVRIGKRLISGNLLDYHRPRRRRRGAAHHGGRQDGWARSVRTLGSAQGLRHQHHRRRARPADERGVLRRLYL